MDEIDEAPEAAKAWDRKSVEDFLAELISVSDLEVEGLEMMVELGGMTTEHRHGRIEMSRSLMESMLNLDALKLLKSELELLERVTECKVRVEASIKKLLKNLDPTEFSSVEKNREAAKQYAEKPSIEARVKKLLKIEDPTEFSSVEKNREAAKQYAEKSKAEAKKREHIRSRVLEITSSDSARIWTSTELIREIPLDEEERFHLHSVISGLCVQTRKGGRIERVGRGTYRFVVEDEVKNG